MTHFISDQDWIMPINVCCIAFKAPNTCTHPCAPKTWFGTPSCIEISPVTSDVRVPNFCALKHPPPRPSPPIGPPNTRFER